MTDVLIVGAGPTGLTLACDLARRGIATQIIDRARRPAACRAPRPSRSRPSHELDDDGAPLEPTLERFQRTFDRRTSTRSRAASA